MILTAQELNTIQGLLHYLNNGSRAELTFDVKVIDSNGNAAGSLYWSEPVEEYVFAPVGEA